MSFLPDGSRATGSSQDVDAESLILVGGSLTQGFAVSDHETFAWKLQQKHPGVTVTKYGTGAYGTYQSLLTLEQVFARQETPALVLYGFYEGHTQWRTDPIAIAFVFGLRSLEEIEAAFPGRLPEVLTAHFTR